MYLELEYYGQNDGTCVPNCVLTGDPGVDNATLDAGGFKSGAIVSIVPSAAGYAAGVTGSATNLVVGPLDGGLTAGSTGGVQYPYGFLILGAGQFSSSITPAGSGKTPVVRAYPKFKVPTSQCKLNDTFLNGKYVYAATGADKGKFTVTAGAANSSGIIPVGICTHVPSTSEPWLGVAAII